MRNNSSFAMNATGRRIEQDKSGGSKSLAWLLTTTNGLSWGTFSAP
jgi:hypothetical protein